MSIFWEDFLCGEYSFLDGCLAIRNGRVGRVGCLECWVSDKKSLDFYILEDYPSNHAWYLHSGNHQKKKIMALNVSRYHSWIVCFLNHLNVIRWFVHHARQHGPGATGWKNWIQVTTSCRTTQRHFCRVGHGQLDIPDGTATNPGKVGNSVPFDNVRTRKWQWEWECVCMFCIVLYDTKPAVEYRKQSPAVCACMHA